MIGFTPPKTTKYPVKVGGSIRVVLDLNQDPEVVHEFSYRNPYVLAVMYYVDGYSTVHMAEMLGCHDRTIRRYMDRYGLRRFTKQFSAYVHLYGIEQAVEIATPEYYINPVVEVNDHGIQEETRARKDNLLQSTD